MTPGRPDPSGPVSVLGKVMAVLHAFRADDGALPFAELQRRTGLAKATLHRLLGELVGEGLLDRTERGYRLGSHLFELGMRAALERGLLEVATPFLEDVYERTHEIVHLGVREGTEVVYVAKVGGHRQAKSPSRLGGRMPLHATAIGKVLLAHAPETVRTQVLSVGLDRLTPRTITAPGVLRKQLDVVLESGIAYEFEESAIGLVCVAAAISGPDDEVLAAVSVSGPVTRFLPSRHAGAVHAAATGVAAMLARRAEREE